MKQDPIGDLIWMLLLAGAIVVVVILVTSH